MADHGAHLTFERSRDYALIRAIVLESYDWTSDDGSPAREQYAPPESDAIWYILARDGEDLLGLWILVPHNAIEYEVHTCLLRGHGYRRGRLAAQEAIEWVWHHTPARRLITRVPAFNRIAYKFALDAGFEPFGVDKKSFLKAGNLYDQAILGLSPEE